MKRRDFNKLCMGGAMMTLMGGKAMGTEPNETYKAKFAPHPGLLPGAPKDYLGQLQFAYDLGFRAWEDNILNKQTPEIQEKVGAFCRDKKIQLGVTVICGGQGVAMGKADAEAQERYLKDMRDGVEFVKRTGQTHMTMVPGIRQGEEPIDKQIAAAADLMKRCCDVVEGAGIIMVQEPLSHGIQGGAPLLRSFEEGFLLCELVNRPSCKLLADFYHEGQIGNPLIPNAEKVWSQVAYVQYGDVPGRKEPGSGKLDYKAVTAWLRQKGYEGVIGMEHGVSAAGEEGLRRLLAGYRNIDA